MLFLAKFLANLLSILNSEVSPKQIAAGFSWGVLIGLCPLGGILSTFLILLAFMVNINLAMMSAAVAIFKIFAFAIDPIANRIGFFLLVKSGLKPFWTHLYNMPVVPYTRFNNTIVLGSFVIGLILLVPSYFLAGWAVIQYRVRWREKILKLKIIQMAKASSIYQWYETYRGIRGQ